MAGAILMRGTYHKNGLIETCWLVPCWTTSKKEYFTEIKGKAYKKTVKKKLPGFRWVTDRGHKVGKVWETRREATIYAQKHKWIRDIENAG